MLWTERMLVYEVLPTLQSQVRSESLAQALDEHLEETRHHVANVENAFRAVGAETSSALSAPADGLQRAHDETAQKLTEPQLADVFHASAAITTEHLEIASYDALLELARALGATDAAKLLDENRAQEAAALATLSKLLPQLSKELSS
jgi:ferritin-like metal-binding protein YciE